MIVCAMMLLFMVNVGTGQESSKYEKVTVKVYNEKNEILTDRLYEGSQAMNIDIQQLLLNHQDKKRINVHATFYKGMEVTRVYFDSNNISNFHEAEFFCEKIETTMKPYFGVGVYSVDDMTGVTVEKIVRTSPAQASSLMLGDVIINFNTVAVGTFCDLQAEISACQVGQQVEMEFERNGQLYKELVTIGGQINNTLSYEVCEKPKLDLTYESEAPNQLSVYPNPTNGVANLTYSSSTEEEVFFYVMDTNGSIIHKEQLIEFKDLAQVQYTFVDEAAGIYWFIIEQGDKVHKQQVVYSRK